MKIHQAKNILKDYKTFKENDLKKSVYYDLSNFTKIDEYLNYEGEEREMLYKKYFADKYPNFHTDLFRAVKASEISRYVEKYLDKIFLDNENKKDVVKEFKEEFISKFFGTYVQDPTKPIDEHKVKIEDLSKHEKVLPAKLLKIALANLKYAIEEAKQIESKYSSPEKSQPKGVGNSRIIEGHKITLENGRKLEIF